MARVPGGSVNGSQFFIQKAGWPDPGPTAVYNRFGTVISGMDKVQILQIGDTIPSITISLWAGTSRSTVLQRTTSTGSPAIPPATSYSRCTREVEQ